VPIIAQTGERILSRPQTAAYDAMTAGGSKARRSVEHDVHSPITVVTPDAGSFRRSETQVSAHMQSVVQRSSARTTNPAKANTTTH